MLAFKRRHPDDTIKNDEGHTVFVYLSSSDNCPRCPSLAERRVDSVDIARKKHLTRSATADVSHVVRTETKIIKVPKKNDLLHHRAVDHI